VYLVRLRSICRKHRSPIATTILGVADNFENEPSHGQRCTVCKHETLLRSKKIQIQHTASAKQERTRHNTVWSIPSQVLASPFVKTSLLPLAIRWGILQPTPGRIKTAGRLNLIRRFQLGRENASLRRPSMSQKRPVPPH
jgi:hypothetical protein